MSGSPLVTFSEYALSCKYNYVGPDAINGGECCWHPEQETRERPRPKGRKYGCCWMGSCPMLYMADLFVLKNWDIDLYQEYKELIEDNKERDERDSTVWDRGGEDWMVLRDAEDKLEDMEKMLKKRLILVLRQVMEGR